jgi:uncharacterized protein
LFCIRYLISTNRSTINKAVIGYRIKGMTTNIIARIQEIEKVLIDHKPFMEKELKVKEIGIFGSFLRGKQKKSSDLDILVEFSEPIGLFHFIRLEDFLTKITGIKVDLVMKSALKPRIKDRILQEVRYI